jgi:hypothetical protein
MEEFTKEKKKQLAKNRERLILEREGFVARSSTETYRRNFDKIKWGKEEEVNKEENVDFLQGGFCDE